MLVFEVHVVAFLDQLDHLTEAVHVELPDERLHVSVAEEARQHLVLQLLGLLDEDLGVATPCQVVAILVLLNGGVVTSRMW